MAEDTNKLSYVTVTYGLGESALLIAYDPETTDATTIEDAIYNALDDPHYDELNMEIEDIVRDSVKDIAKSIDKIPLIEC